MKNPEMTHSQALAYMRKVLRDLGMASADIHDDDLEVMLEYAREQSVVEIESLVSSMLG